MKNNQRKNKKSLVLVAMILMIGLVAGMGAMTYSRYVTSSTPVNQTATAAKWGYVIDVDADELFGANYKDGVIVTAGTAGIDVKASSDPQSNIVAPGTKGSMTINLSGQAEVLAKLTFTAAKTSDIAYGTYYPVKWTVNDGSTTSAAMTLEDLVDYLNDLTDVIEPGTPITKEYTISWSWELHVDDETDQKDTLIGFRTAGITYAELANAMVDADTTYQELVVDEANYTAITTKLAFTLSISVEQIQCAEA